MWLVHKVKYTRWSTQGEVFNIHSSCYCFRGLYYGISVFEQPSPVLVFHQAAYLIQNFQLAICNARISRGRVY